MARLTVELTGLDGLQKMQQFLNPALFKKAQQGGVSYAAKAVPPAVAKGITASYNITSSRVKKDISGIRFAGDGQSASIGFSRRAPTLTQFKPNPGRRGGPQPGLGRGMGWGSPKPAGKPVTATIIKAKGRQSFPGAFIATGANGNRLVLRREGERLRGVYGPSIGSIFLGQSAIGPTLRADVQARISEQYIKGFQRVIDSAARGYAK